MPKEKRRRPVIPGKCMYCDSVGEDFPDEHPIARAAGQFRGLKLIRDRVCGPCNNAIGQTEQALFRYTYYFLERERYGIEGRDRGNQDEGPFCRSLKGLRLRLRAIVPGVPYPILVQVFHGDRVEPVPQITLKCRNELIPYPLPQGLRTSDDLKWYLRESLPLGAQIIAAWFEMSQRDRVRRLIRPFFKKLKQKDTVVTDLPNAERRVAAEFECELDSLAFRAIAKTAFHLWLVEGPDGYTGHESCFRALRRFIRYGEGDWKRFVLLDHGYVIDTIAGAPGAKRSIHAVTFNATPTRLTVKLQLYLSPAQDRAPEYWVVSLGTPPHRIWAPNQERAISLVHYDKKSSDGFEGEVVRHQPSAGILMPSTMNEFLGYPSLKWHREGGGGFWVAGG